MVTQNAQSTNNILHSYDSFKTKAVYTIVNIFPIIPIFVKLKVLLFKTKRKDVTERSSRLNNLIGNPHNIIKFTLTTTFSD